MFKDFPYNKVELMFGLMMIDGSFLSGFLTFLNSFLIDYYKNVAVISAAQVVDYVCILQ